MVAARLRELLIAGAGMGDLEGPDVRVGRAEHPVCGDSVQLSVRRAGDRIVEVKWRAAGCPASMATAALAAAALVNVPAAAAPVILREAIAAHGGLAAHERHAEGMVLRALAAAVHTT